MIVLSLLTGCVSFAQDCDYKRNEVDEFTKKTILETKEEALAISGMGMGFSCTYNLLKIDGIRYLKLHVYSPKIFTLKQGSNIMLKTDKENPITLTFPETVIADHSYNSSIKTTHWSGIVLIPISDDAYNRMRNENISKLRVYTADGYIDDDVKAKHDKKIKKALTCIQ